MTLITNNHLVIYVSNCSKKVLAGMGLCTTTLGALAITGLNKYNLSKMGSTVH